MVLHSYLRRRQLFFYSTSVLVEESTGGGGSFLGVGRVVAMVFLMVVRVATTTNEESTWKQLEACIITMIHFLQLARRAEPTRAGSLTFDSRRFVLCS